MEENEKRLTSTYNQAVSQLIRLDRAWSNCNYYSSIGELKKWKWQLDVIWRELIADCKLIDNEKKENDKYKTQINNVNILIAKSDSDVKLYNALSKKEEILRLLEDDAGKGSKRKIEDEDDFDE